MWKQCFIIGPSYAGEVDIIRYNIRIIRYLYIICGDRFSRYDKKHIGEKVHLDFRGATEGVSAGN